MSGMRRLMRAVGMLAIAIVAALAIGAVVVFAMSERVIHRTYDVALEAPIEIPTDAASIAEGERLARIRGCNGGCHGERVGGRAWDEGAWQGRAMAPDLADVARKYSTAELVRTIRYGVRRNGEGVEIMPSPMFYHLSDADLGRIIAFLRSEPVTDAHAYAFDAGPMWRWQMATGEWLPWPEEIGRLGPRIEGADAGDPVRHGEYLARTSCTECHGDALEGQNGTPNLVVAAAYSPADFKTLLRTGTALGGRELRLMSGVARSRFHFFTDAEIEALHAYFRQRAQAAR